MAETDPAFTLIPADEAVSPEDDLAAAVAARLENPFELAETPGTREPFGRTIAFDWERGVMKRNGVTPIWVSGHAALREWVMMVLHSAWLAHPVFSDEFGMEQPDGPLGEGSLHDIDAAISDFGENFKEGVEVHDRVASLEDFEAEWLEDDGIVHIIGFTVTTDEDERVRFEGIDVATVTED